VEAELKFWTAALHLDVTRLDELGCLDVP